MTTEHFEAKAETARMEFCRLVQSLPLPQAKRDEIQAAYYTGMGLAAQLGAAQADRGWEKFLTRMVG